MGHGGFTLIEVILLVVVMGIVLPSLVAAVSFITQGQVHPMATTVAGTLAQEEMEGLVAKKRSACAACGYANIPIGFGAFAPVAGFPDYQVKTDVEWVDAAMNPSGVDLGYKRVTVTVRPMGVAPNLPDAVLVTLLTDY